MAKIGANPFAKKGPKGAKPAINVTPLVDVVLVLLIIFIVTLPNMQEQKAIELINVKDSDEMKSPDEPDPLFVTLAADGTFECEEQDMNRDQVIATLTEKHESEPTRRVVLRVDARVQHSEVRSMIKDVQQAGYKALSFAVGEQREWNEEDLAAGAEEGGA